VPVFENTKATSGNVLSTFSIWRCILVDCVSAVLNQATRH
jgi:hypothetical protein